MAADILVEVDQNFITQNISVGRARKKKARDLYKIYHLKLGGTNSYDSFYRDLRTAIETARRNGVYVIGDTKGFHIAENKKEWLLYITEGSMGSRIDSLITTAAMSIKVSQDQYVKTLFPSLRKNRKIVDSAQLGLGLDR